MRILLVEDEEQLADATARGLRHHGFAVDVCHDGAEALDRTRHTAYDIVVLDRDLPNIHGDQVCDSLAGGESRILMLTALGSLDDRVDGLNLGADDYLPKPFALRELVARVHALGRRTARSDQPQLNVGDISLDPATFRVDRAGRPVTLTRREFGVLEALLRASPAPLSAEELLERVWDEHADPFTGVVRVVMVTLRRKLGEPNPITTIKGVGYRIDEVGT